MKLLTRRQFVLGGIVTIISLILLKSRRAILRILGVPDVQKAYAMPASPVSESEILQGGYVLQEIRRGKSAMRNVLQKMRRPSGQAQLLPGS